MASPSIRQTAPPPSRHRTRGVRMRSWYDKTGFWLLLLLPVTVGDVIRLFTYFPNSHIGFSVA